MTLDEIRKQYPQYDKVSDDKLADALYKKHYSHADRGEFNKKIGYTPQTPFAKAQSKLKKTINDVDRETGVQDYNFRYGLGKADTLEERIAYLNKTVGKDGYVTTKRHNKRMSDFALNKKGLEKLNLGHLYKDKPVAIDESGMTRYDIADASQQLLPMAGALTAGLATGGLGMIPAMGIMGAVGGGLRATEELGEHLAGENLQSFGSVAGDVARTAALEAAGEGIGRTIALPFRYLMGPNMRRAGSIFGKRAPAESIVDPALKETYAQASKLGVRPNVHPATGQNPIAGFAQRLSHTLTGGSPAAQRNLKALTGERGRIMEKALGGAKRSKDFGQMFKRETQMLTDAFERDIVKQSKNVQTEVNKALSGIGHKFGKHVSPEDVGNNILLVKKDISDVANKLYTKPDTILGKYVDNKIVDMSGVQAVARNLMKQDIPGVKGLNDQARTFLGSLSNKPVTLGQAFKLSERLNKNAYNPDLLNQVGDFEARSIKDAVDAAIEQAGHRIRSIQPGTKGQFLPTQKQKEAVAAYQKAKDFYKTRMGEIDTALIRNLGKQAKTGEISHKSVLQAVENADAKDINKLFHVLGPEADIVRKMHFNQLIADAGVEGRKAFDPKKLRSLIDNFDKHGRFDAIYGREADEIYNIAKQLDDFSAGALPEGVIGDGPLKQTLKNALAATKDKRLLLENDFVKILKEGDTGARYNDVVDMMVNPTGDAIEKIRHARTILDQPGFNQLREKAMWKMLSPLTKQGESGIGMVVDGTAINKLVKKIEGGTANPIIELFGKEGPAMWRRIKQLGQIAEQTTLKGSNGIVAMNVALHPLKNLGKLAQVNLIGKFMSSKTYLDWMVHGWKAEKARHLGTGVQKGLTQGAAAVLNSIMQEVKVGYEDENE